MTVFDISVLKQRLDAHRGNPLILNLWEQLDAAGNDIDQILQIYAEAVPLLEAAIWADEINEGVTAQHQQMFQEMERLIAQRGEDDRHEIVIVIPVADRPRHLSNCLGSLLMLCRSFHYGGSTDGRFGKVSVIVADDSKEPGNTHRHRIIADHFDRMGLPTEYFGLDEQLGLLAKLPAELRLRLTRLIGDVLQPPFYHKGASIMRNIAYLKLNSLAKEKSKALFYFIDSDQEFQVTVPAADGDRNRYAVNYLYHLDRIFTNRDIGILTGKVVGDPPVSPSVMAGNFLEDVIAFLSQTAELDPRQDCRFHDNYQQTADDAAYHDMADLFGFKPTSGHFHYRCPLRTEHNHIDSFCHFADRLDHFFDGGHPTRKTYYEHLEVNSSVKLARTVYTGNYIFRPEALMYFIPFATLKLRMAGPTLGRIIQSEIEQRFVSANLPMLHKRTMEQTGESEFRPGIDREFNQVDLSGEFERQFFGDVMLFSIVRLTEIGFPNWTPGKQEIADTVKATEQQIYKKYMEKQRLITDRLNQLKKLFEQGSQWWHKMPELNRANHQIRNFIRNIEHNFGSDAQAYRLIDSKGYKEKRLQQIADAIAEFKDDRAAWNEALKQ